MPTDKQLVASKQTYELRTVCRKFHIGIKELRKIMLEMTGTGKPARSREDIEAELIERGFSAMVLPEDTHAPDLSGHGPYVNS